MAGEVRDRAYYNENDPFAAAWIRNLIAENLIAPGDVDERSIVDVQAHDLRDYTQCHFFAGIGGWSYALRLAGWPDERPVWTGSCPCQPFSVAGAGKGTDDPRHLWPAWQKLIAANRPDTIFGEQVDAAIRFGWLDLVFDDLEDLGYACGATVAAALRVGAPHIRKRLFWVADANEGECGRLADGKRREPDWQALRWLESNGFIDPSCIAQQLVDADGRSASTEGIQRSGQQRLVAKDGHSVLVGNANEPGSQRRSFDLGECADQLALGQTSEPREMADTAHEYARRTTEPGETQSRWSFGDAARRNAWSHLEWLPCTDGKARPTQSGIFPLVDGFPNRVGLLRGAGNAIVPQVAAEFIKAVMDCIPMIDTSRSPLCEAAQ